MLLLHQSRTVYTLKSFQTVTVKEGCGYLTCIELFGLGKHSQRKGYIYIFILVKTCLLLYSSFNCSHTRRSFDPELV